MLVLLVAMVVLWMIVSVPVYAAGSILSKGATSFGQAMGATLGGGLAYFVVLYGSAILLGMLVGPSSVALGFVLAIFAWVAVYRAALRTSWPRTLGVVSVAWTVFLFLNLFLVSQFGVSFPKFYPF